MNYSELADLLFPGVDKTPEYYEALYPPRELPKGAEVTRIAPSPTGFIHLGNLFGALTDERVARQSNGVFYLRIEDTDEKRKVEGAVEAVLDSLSYFGLEFDEGAETGGDYGPYYQRRRAELYACFCKKLVSEGLAYPCFCSEEELSAVREIQLEAKDNTGYWGKYAKCRDLRFDEIKSKLEQKLPYVIRLRSNGDENVKFIFRDEIKGELTVCENNLDIVLLKRDGIPTYHFAHVIDDHFMRTTTVVRGEEWVATLPIHLQLFRMLGFKAPKYAHTAQLMKMDGDKKRKLSKRLDPELSLEYYKKLGYHPKAVKTYLMTMLNSNFEEWFLKNPQLPLEDFKFSLKKMGQSGALFDTMKLDDISKTVLSYLSPDDVVDFFESWARDYIPDDYPVYFACREYITEIVRLTMAVGEKKRRRDLVCASRMPELFSYFYPELFIRSEEFRLEGQICADILRGFLETYDETDDNSVWFDKLKSVAEGLGFAIKASDYKNNPDAYRGFIGDAAEVVRVAVTGRKNTPDLCTIMKIIGRDECVRRINEAISAL